MLNSSDPTPALAMAQGSPFSMHKTEGAYAGSHVMGGVSLNAAEGEWFAVFNQPSVTTAIL